MKFRTILTAPVVLYQKIISPLIPSRCRYSPSCSEYTRRSILKFGFFRGWALGLARIFRCWSWFGPAVDPVPEEWHRGVLSGGYRKFYNGPGSHHLNDDDGSDHSD